MKRLLPVLFIVILAIALSIAVNYLDQNTQKNEIQTSQMEIVDRIILTYNYYTPESTTESASNLTIEITNSEEVQALTKSLENLDTTNYSDKVGLLISGIYQVDFQNGTRILFDTNSDEYATLINNEKKSLIKVPTEFKDSIIKKVDEQLTEKAKQYQTENITVTQEGIEPIQINDQYALERILENSKNIAVNKNIDTKNFEKNYEINFNNGIRIEVYTKEYIGKQYNEGQEGEKLVKLPVELVDLIDNRINNEKNGKIELFQTDLVTIEHAGVSTEINESERVEAITKRLMYSKISHLNYLDTETFKIETTPDDYILNVNGNQIIIYGGTTYASRQIVYQDGTYDDITFMKGLEEYIKSLVTQ